jgi:Ca2+-binding RTX toxin-like protein
MVRRTLVSSGLVLLLVTAAVSTVGAAGDQSARGRCIAAAARAGLLGRDANPGNTTFIAGTEGDDDFTGRNTAGPDVFCGFGGNDFINRLDAGDVFIGGAGDDRVVFLNGGTFDGGAGNDSVDFPQEGTFDGGAGDDRVVFLNGDVFIGGAGDDRVVFLNGGTFDGGAGDDRVAVLNGGTFDGGAGDDRVDFPQEGTFNPD